MNRRRFEKGGAFSVGAKAAAFVPAAALVLGALFFLGACNTGLDPDTGTDEKIFNDLPYGSHEKQKLDLIFPDVPANINKAIPAVLYIHGGAWISGNKDEETFNSLKTSAAAAGLAAASMNYRLLGAAGSSDTDCNDMLDDVHAAVNLVKKKSLELGVEINKLCVIGVSAGAHLALLYSYTRAGQSPLPIELCVSASGPTDFNDPSWYDDAAGELSGDLKLRLVSALTGKTFTTADYEALKSGGAADPDKVQALEEISPITYAAGAVPTLLAHGKKDSVVPFSNAERLKNALPSDKNLGFFEFINSGHGLDAPEDESIRVAFFRKLEELIAKLKG
ncbi:MAG: alpha/beta hydrolase [Treponema sp.]|jgi:acetyl esterase/lipase|nr:alpha/beta hydrolase [Treponema sp.]